MRSLVLLSQQCAQKSNLFFLFFYLIILAILEKRKLVQVEENIETNKIYTSSQAAAFLKIKPQSLIRARGKGRIKGKLIDGREYGYEYEELKKYVRGAHKKVTA